jgi:hypothetical protein
MEKPTAVPQATGSRIAAAGFSNRKLGSVREGMYEVMFARMLCFEHCQLRKRRSDSQSKDLILA